eukprot:sb/3470961/
MTISDWLFTKMVREDHLFGFFDHHLLVQSKKNQIVMVDSIAAYSRSAKNICEDRFQSRATSISLKMAREREGRIAIRVLLMDQESGCADHYLSLLICPFYSVWRRSDRVGGARQLIFKFFTEDFTEDFSFSVVQVLILFSSVPFDLPFVDQFDTSESFVLSKAPVMSPPIAGVSAAYSFHATYFDFVLFISIQ